MARVIRSRLAFAVLGVIAGLIIGTIVGALDMTRFHRSAPKESPEKRQLDTNRVGSGRWREAPKPSLNEEQREAIRKLETLGYVSGSQPAPREDGITIHDESKAYGGLNLVVSGHAPEALLMDMSGDTLHTWKCDVYRAWPGFESDQTVGRDQLHTFWRRARLLPNGDLFAIFERIGLIKLDRQSRVVWAVKNRAHHDLDVDENGNIYVLTGEERINKTHNAEQAIWEDYISVLDPQGRELKRVPVLEALQNSDFVSVLYRAEREGDILHTNTIELIKELPRDAATPFRKGTVIIAIRHLDLVCAVDLESQTVYWAESDFWHWQHQPTLLDNGNLLVLDNMRRRQSSAVIELEPVSRHVKWSYVGGVDGAFYTTSCGSCQRLPNGNTLITESDPGRAFEVAPDKTIVWEYVNPHRAGEEEELIATLFEVVRLPKDFAVGWLPAGSRSGTP